MCDYLSEEQIEIRVQRMTDRLDKRYMESGSRMTEADYKAELKRIDDWSEAEYEKQPPKFD